MRGESRRGDERERNVGDAGRPADPIEDLTEYRSADDGQYGHGERKRRKFSALLKMLRASLPQAARIAVLVNPAFAPTTETTLRDVQSAARAMGLQIQVLNANTSREIDAAFATFSCPKCGSELRVSWCAQCYGTGSARNP